MKIRILIAAVIVAVLAALAGAGFFIYQALTKPEPENKTPIAEVSTDNQSPGGEKEKVNQETKLIKDDFEVTLPPGWEEFQSPLESVLAMGIDANEDVSAEKFQKIGFRTNFAIKSESRTNYPDISDLKSYVESIKTSLVQSIAGITFPAETQKTVNGNEAYFIECDTTQQEGSFRTLLVFIETDDLTVYAISFNTFSEFWPVYKGSFYRIAESFKVKYQIQL